MNIKHIICAFLTVTSFLASCSQFTEIDAKGNNLLSSTSDLELLLNAEYGHYNSMALGVDDLNEIAGDYIYSYQRFSNILAGTAKSQKAIRITWDEKEWVSRLPELTSSDSFYTGCYYYIGRIANPILAQIDKASGDDAKKAAIKAEALLIRAYFHFLVVQKFIPAYTPDKAASTTGLVYLTEKLDIKTANAPVNLETFYLNILNDLQEAEKLNALPDKAINRMRFCKGALYAVKALVLTSMQRFDEAAAAAKQALDSDNTLVDFNKSMATMYVSKDDTSPQEPHPVFTRPRMEFAEDYFTVYGVAYYNCITPYAQSFFEPGHVFNYYLNTTSLGRSKIEAEKLSIQTTGESGYIITSLAQNDWYPTIGLRTSQMYLVLAEAAIHGNKLDEAMGYLDKIRVNRILPDMYAPLQGTNPDRATAIRYLKMSAETEGLLSIWNFVNRKRWNALGAEWEETINRTLCGIDMTLRPDSKLWNFPIPKNVISNNPNFKPFLN